MAQAGLMPFRPRLPWLGGDLQTLRDSLRPVPLPPDGGRPLRFDLGHGDQLLGLLDEPPGAPGLVVVLHGLAGGSDRLGVRRLAFNLQRAGFAVLRLNLRGAGPGRPLARGTYAACSNRDLLAIWPQLRALAAGRPLLGAGLSLGGTNLLNALLAAGAQAPLLEALACVSSPLDLIASSRQIARRRNRLYEHWLLRRLVRDTQADPGGITAAEHRLLQQAGSIRDFDAAITAPRWRHASVDAYYQAASVLPRLLDLATVPKPALPPLLLLHAIDDPWVPSAAAEQLAAAVAPVQVLLTASGGHNGFHGVGDGPLCSFSDAVVVRWLLDQLAACQGC